MNEITLAGIKANGLRWRKQLKIKQYIPDNIPASNINHQSVFRSVIPAIKLASGSLHEDFISLVEDWEFTLDEDYLSALDLVEHKSVLDEELIDFLNALYDLAGYHRILIC